MAESGRLRKLADLVRAEARSWGGQRLRGARAWMRSRPWWDRETRLAALKKRLRTERSLYAQKLQARDEARERKIAGLHQAYQDKLNARDALYRKKLLDRDAHLAKLQARVEFYEERLLEREAGLGKLQARIDAHQERATSRDALAGKLQARVDAYQQKLREQDEGHRAVAERRREDHTATTRALRGQLQAVQSALSVVARHEYGSVTPGVQDWRDKWARSAGRRILLYATKDYAGAMVTWAKAINQHTDFAARLVALRPHEYGYDVDLILPQPDPVRSDLLGLAAEADVIHIMDEVGFLDGSNGLPADVFDRFGKPIVFTQYGGLARMHRDDPAYRSFVLRMSARVAMTPDLVFPWFDGCYIPTSIDTDLHRHSWTDGSVIAHSPSDQQRKGTRDLIEAVGRLREAKDVQLDLIHGVSHAECLERKGAANLFFDQAGRESPEKLGTDAVIGWYGVSALESAVLGIPTIAHLSEAAFEGARRGGADIRDRCAIVNTPLGADGIEHTLREYFEMSAEGRRALSKDTRRWVEEFHSQQAVGAQLARLYRSL